MLFCNQASGTTCGGWAGHTRPLTLCSGHTRPLTLCSMHTRPLTLCSVHLPGCCCTAALNSFCVWRLDWAHEVTAARERAHAHSNPAPPADDDDVLLLPFPVARGGYHKLGAEEEVRAWAQGGEHGGRGGGAYMGLCTEHDCCSEGTEHDWVFFFYGLHCVLPPSPAFYPSHARARTHT